MLCAREAKRPADSAGREDILSAQRVGTRPPSINSGTVGLCGLRYGRNASTSYRGLVQSLSEIGQDVVNVFDADAQAQHLGSDAHLDQFLGRELPVSG